MSLRFAILGLLSREPMTGYDLTKQFDTTIGFFWCAKHSQIYPELAALSKEGLVTFEVVTQTSKPNKKVYTITPAGHDALGAWMGEPSDKRAVKDPLLMRTWVIGVMEPALAIRQLREALVVYELRCEHMRLLERELGGETQNPTLDNLWLGAGLALRCGLMQAEAYRDWLLWAIARLEAAKHSRQVAVAAAS